MQSNKKSKLGSTLLFVIIVLIVGILTIVMESIALSTYEKKWKSNTVRYRITMIAQSISSSVRDLLSSGDEMGISWQLSNILRNYKGIRYAVVVDRDDRIVGKAGLSTRDQYFKPKEAWLRQTGTTEAFGKVERGGKLIYQIGIPIMPEGIKARLGSIYLAADDTLIGPQEYSAFSSLKKKIYLWSGIALLIMLLLIPIAVVGAEGGVTYPEDTLKRVVITESDTFEHISMVKGVTKRIHFPQSNSVGLEFEHFAKEGMVLLPFLKERSSDMIYGFISSPYETTDTYLTGIMLHEAALRAIKEDVNFDSIMDQLYLYLDFIALRGAIFNMVLVQIDKKGTNYRIASIGRNYFADIKDENEAQFTLLESKPIGYSPNIGEALLPSNIVTVGGELKSALYFGAYPDETILERLEKMIEVQNISPVELEKIQDLGGFGIVSLARS